MNIIHEFCIQIPAWSLIPVYHWITFHSLHCEQPHENTKCNPNEFSTQPINFGWNNKNKNRNGQKYLHNYLHPFLSKFACSEFQIRESTQICSTDAGAEAENMSCLVGGGSPQQLVIQRRVWRQIIPGKIFGTVTNIRVLLSTGKSSLLLLLVQRWAIGFKALYYRPPFLSTFSLSAGALKTTKNLQ